MALPLFAIILGAGAVVLLAKASTKKETGIGCRLNGEELSAALAKLDSMSSPGMPLAGSAIQAALGNPMAKASDLRALAAATRRLKANGFTEADDVAACIDAKADSQAAAGNP